MESGKDVEFMKMNIVDCTNGITILELKKSVQNNGNLIWTSENEQLRLRLSSNNSLENVTVLEKSDNIVDSEAEIKRKFSDWGFEQKIAELTKQEDGFDDADEEENEVEKINPYDPRLIRVDTKTFSVSMVNQMIKDNEIDLSPDFQRGFVWTDITRKSRLIESLLLRIPIPAFYFSQDEEGLFQVVDGVQRLTVLSSFMNNEFKLKNLEYLTECNGKWFMRTDKYKKDNLDSIYTRRIEQTQLFINIIDPQTPGRVKYDIFKRINTGGRALNNQEIRNCLANAGTRQLLHELSGSQSFLMATRGSISHTRMADEELILRFIAFYLIDHQKTNVQEYKGGMDLLLDETVEKLNTADLELMKEVRYAFLRAMDNAHYLFGERAFRKAKYINKALFLGVSRALCGYEVEKIKQKDKIVIAERLNFEMEKNIEFKNALSMATNDAKNVKLVYDVVNRILEEESDA
jgi:hypothetical protein